MNNRKEIKDLENILVRILEAKNEKNLTKENKEIALKDLIKILNLYWKLINKKIQYPFIINKYQNIWFCAIKNLKQKVKFPLIDITPNLFRCYIITLFKSIKEEKILNQLTKWDFSMLQKEKLTYDMKILFLSINEMVIDNAKNLTQSKEEEINN